MFSKIIYRLREMEGIMGSKWSIPQVGLRYLNLLLFYKTSNVSELSVFKY